MSKLLPLLLKKEQHEWFTYDSSESLSNTSNSLEKVHIFHIFHMFNIFSLLFLFFLFLWVNLSCCSSLICSFLKSDGSELLLLLFTKERMWGNRSGHSWQKKAIVAFALFHGQIAHSLTKNERFDQKIYEQLPNPENYKPNWIPNFCFGNCSLK